MVVNDLKVQSAVNAASKSSTRSQPRNKGLISSVMIGHFFKIYIFIHFLTTNPRFALALRCEFSHIT